MQIRSIIHARHSEIVASSKTRGSSHGRQVCVCPTDEEPPTAVHRTSKTNSIKKSMSLRCCLLACSTPSCPFLTDFADVLKGQQSQALSPGRCRRVLPRLIAPRRGQLLQSPSLPTPDTKTCLRTLQSLHLGVYAQFSDVPRHETSQSRASCDIQATYVLGAAHPSSCCIRAPMIATHVAHLTCPWKPSKDSAASHHLATGPGEVEKVGHGYPDSSISSACPYRSL